MHPPAGKVRQRRLAHELAEPPRERGSRHVDLARERVERPRVRGPVMEQRDDARDLRVAQRTQPRRRLRVGRRGDPVAQRRDQEHVDQARGRGARPGAPRADLAGEQIDERRDVAAGDRVGRHMHDARQEAHQRLGDIEVVVVPGAHERGHRARTADLERPVGAHQAVLDGAVVWDAAAGRPRRQAVRGPGRQQDDVAGHQRERLGTAGAQPRGPGGDGMKRRAGALRQCEARPRARPPPRRRPPRSRRAQGLRARPGSRRRSAPTRA